MKIFLLQFASDGHAGRRWAARRRSTVRRQARRRRMVRFVL